MTNTYSEKYVEQLRSEIEKLQKQLWEQKSALKYFYGYYLTAGCFTLGTGAQLVIFFLNKYSPSKDWKGFTLTIWVFFCFLSVGFLYKWWNSKFKSLHYRLSDDDL